MAIEDSNLDDVIGALTGSYPMREEGNPTHIDGHIDGHVDGHSDS
jgi:hypothetical protein